MSFIDDIGEKILNLLSNKIILVVLIVDMLLVAGFIFYGPPKPVETSFNMSNLKNYHKEPTNAKILYISLWELHPDFIEVTIVRTYNTSHPGFRIGESLEMGLGSFFVGDIPFEIQMSPNIRDYELVTEKFEYTGRTFDAHSLIIQPEKPSDGVDYLTYYARYKVLRMPHLHGVNGKERVISIGHDPFSGPYMWLTVVAIPKGSEILSVYDFQPYKFDEIDGWQLFFYDSSEITKHESIHILFNQTTDTAASISVENLFPEFSFNYS